MNVCTNCNQESAEVFCARCGEKQPSHHDLTLRHFLHDVVHELVHLDSKLFRTMRELVTKPGLLTAEYFAGRKKRYIAPLRLFLTLFAITFVAYTAVDAVAVYSIKGLESVDRKGQLHAKFEQAAKKRGMTYAELAGSVEHRWQKNMSLVSMVSILVIALVMKLLYRRRYLTEHLVFGTHYMCFAYVVSLAIWPIHLWLGIKQTRGNMVMMVITFVVSCVYIYLALHRVYGQRGAVTFVKSVVVWAVTFVTSLVLMTGSLVAAILMVLRS